MRDIESLSSIQLDYPDLFDWVKSITRYDDFDNFVRVEHLEKGAVRVALWTEVHSYGISAHLPSDGRDGYLGCVVSSRKPLAGEDWTRGNDLPDGSYSVETWREIVNGMLAYELVKVQVRESQLSVEEIGGTRPADVVVGTPC